MGQYSPFNKRRTIIVDPSNEKNITKHTVKIIPLVLTPGNERFPFVKERESFFFRRRRNGEIEQVPKVAGQGCAGGGGLVTEDPVTTGIREGNEELGAPREVLERCIRPEISVTDLSGFDRHPFHLFYVEITEDDVKRGFLDRSKITDPKLVGNKADWARLRELNGTIFPPTNLRQRSVMEAKMHAVGYHWFYFNHTVFLVAMLLRLKKAGRFAPEQMDLPQIVLSQASARNIFSRKMIEMLVDEDAVGVLSDLIYKVRHREDVAFTAVSAAVRAKQDDLARQIVAESDLAWRAKLQEHAELSIGRRDGEIQQVFGSLDEMINASETDAGSWELDEEPTHVDADPVIPASEDTSLDELGMEELLKRSPAFAKE